MFSFSSNDQQKNRRLIILFLTLSVFFNSVLFGIQDKSPYLTKTEGYILGGLAIATGAVVGVAGSGSKHSSSSHHHASQQANGNANFDQDAMLASLVDLTNAQPGPEGKKGNDGKDGKQGPRGERGDRGERGSNGRDGNNGNDGPMGPAGPMGPQGPEGQGFEIETGPAQLFFTFRVPSQSNATGIITGLVTQPDQSMSSIQLPFTAGGSAVEESILIGPPAPQGRYDITLYVEELMGALSSSPSVTITNDQNGDISTFSLSLPQAQGHQTNFGFIYSIDIIP